LLIFKSYYIIIEMFSLIYSKKLGKKLDGKHGLTIAHRLDTNSKKNSTFINIITKNPLEDGQELILEQVAQKDIKTPFQITPRFDMVERILICGQSGSGKSTIASNWIKDYLSIKDKDVFLLSRVEEDKPLDEIKLLQRVDLKQFSVSPEEFALNGLDTEEFKNSIVILDDIDTITDKKIFNNVIALRDDMLETGRHNDITMLCITHVLFQNKNSKKPLNEATGVVLFPRSGSKYHIRRYLKEYCGLEEKQIARIMNLNSRYFYISRTYPNYVVSEREVFLL
jgi:hypothetical protein